MRYKAILAYDGTNYAGFQKLSSGLPTVVGTLEEALGKLFGVPTRVLGAGRTDAGVHATGQVISFDVESWKHGDDKLLLALNATLPTDTAILRLEQTTAGFHPRFNALSRTYRYLLYVAPVRQPRLAHSHWHIKPGRSSTLHVDRMVLSAAHLTGIHDFAAFGSAPEGETGTTVRQVLHSAWTEHPEQDEWGGRTLAYTIEANAFLYHMVRAIVAALVEVGMDRLSTDAFVARFQARRRLGKLAPPHGLTLIRVKYENGGTTPAGDKS